MKERPILFKGEMVRAILAGRKTQTRRLMKPQPPAFFGDENNSAAGHLGEYLQQLSCPHGSPGDRRWVQESYHIIGHGSAGPTMCVKYLAGGDDWIGEVSSETYAKFRARKTSQPLGGRFMYRDISRITLEITSVRVERLNAISEADACDEGIRSKRVMDDPYPHYFLEKEAEWEHAAVPIYANLWEAINGAGSWAANPWVWVITFKRL